MTTEKKYKNYWKKGLLYAFTLFVIVFIISIITIFNSESEAAGLALQIPFFPLLLIVPGFKNLELPIIISLVVNLSAYYLVGVGIAFIKKNIKG